MNIYLAARYSRRKELCTYRAQLTLMGHVVTSRWLNGDHQISDDGRLLGDDGTALVQSDDGSTNVRSVALRDKFAKEDFQDVLMCDMLIAFTEPPRSSTSRGGRHVELGIALGRMKRVWVVGYRENIFCWMEDVQFHENFDSALSAIIKEGSKS